MVRNNGYDFSDEKPPPRRSKRQSARILRTRSRGRASTKTYKNMLSSKERLKNRSPTRNIPIRKQSPTRNKPFRKQSPTRNMPYRKQSPTRNTPFRKQSPTRNTPFRKQSPTRNTHFRKQSPTRNTPFRKQSHCENNLTFEHWQSNHEDTSTLPTAFDNQLSSVKNMSAKLLSSVKTNRNISFSAATVINKPSPTLDKASETQASSKKKPLKLLQFSLPQTSKVKLTSGKETKQTPVEDKCPNRPLFKKLAEPSLDNASEAQLAPKKLQPFVEMSGDQPSSDDKPKMQSQRSMLFYNVLNNPSSNVSFSKKTTKIILRKSSTKEVNESDTNKTNRQMVQINTNNSYMDSHVADLGKLFRNLYTNDQYMDVVVRIGNKSFNCHKSVLMAYSEYFFTRILTTDPHELKEINLSGVEPLAFKAILTYMYMEDIKMTKDNFTDIHYAAKHLMIPRLMQKCDSYLSNNKTANASEISREFLIHDQVRPPDPEKAILVVGGVSQSKSMEGTGKSMFAYYPQKSSWKQLGQMPESRHLHSAVFLMDGLYVVGGCRPLEHSTLADRLPFATATVYKWNVKQKEWSKRSNMKKTRVHHSLVKLNGKLYVLGGQDECGRVLTSVEMYVPELDCWEDVEPLQVGRIGASATAMSGRIMVVGGYAEECTNSNAEYILKSVELYDPKSNSWKSLNDFPYPRFHSSLIEVQGDLYICGGAASRDDDKQRTEMVSIANVDIYDESNDSWKKFATLKYHRYGMKAVGIGAKIYLFGGVSIREGTTFYGLPLECLDTETGSITTCRLECQAELGMGVAVCYADILDVYKSRFDKLGQNIKSVFKK